MKITINTSEMTVDEVVEALYRYGSQDDPIWYRGKETSPNDLSCEIDGTQVARNIRIKFYAGKGKDLTLVRGTLASMLRERASTIRDRG